MWCRITRQPAESWMLLTRAERDAMAELAVEIQQETKREIDKANARTRTGIKGVRRGR